MGLDLKIFCVRGSSDVITFLCLYRCDTCLCLSTAPFLCTKRKSSLIHFLFNNPAATLRQVSSTPLITCTKCRAICTLNTLVAESQTNSVSTSAPWRSPLTTPISFVFGFFHPLVERLNPPDHNCFSYMFLSVILIIVINELVMRKRQKRKKEKGLTFTQPFYRVE